MRPTLARSYPWGRLPTAWLALAVLGGCQDYTIKAPPSAAALEDTDGPLTPPADAPDIEVEPGQIGFGLLPPGCPSGPVLVEVRNVGGSDLTVHDIGFRDGTGAFAHTAQPAVLAPGASATFTVEFLAPGLGSWTDALQIHSDDPDEGVLDLPLSATVAGTGLITDGFIQDDAGSVDVLFVLDNSGSMSDNLNALGAAFPTFINAFVGLGLDYQIGVVTTDMDDPAQSGRLVGPIVSNSTPDPVAAFVALTQTGSEGSADERGLDAAYAALEPTMGLIGTTNAGLVRPDANLAILVISDENDSSSINPAPFSAWLNNYKSSPDRSSLSIVGGPKAGLLPCFSIFNGVSATPVPRYWAVAQQTGGIHVNLCNVDFTTILQQLSTVAAGLQAAYTLQGLPDPSTIQVEVNGVPMAQDPNTGWSYDAATNTVRFAGPAVPPEGADVEITYEGEVVCAP